MTPQDLESWLDDDAARRPLVMGVLNVTPDSFSDGGQHLAPAAAAERARQMIDEGADWIDVGGESTRPGGEAVSVDEQRRRVLPVVEALRPLDVVLSIDTTRAAVARDALAAGASVVNDTAAATADADMPAVMAAAAAVVLMHMRGTPATMSALADYADVTAEVADYLQARVAAVAAAGVDRRRVLLDPGIGFAKTTAHNLRLLRDLPRLASLGRPLLVGTSRKRFIGEITGEPDAGRRIFGTAATVAWSVANGASVVRVHDVRAMRQVVDMTRAMLA